MLKLKGYLKPFGFMLALALALLFVQALCDLNLPNYMSRIVNVGIQQGGVEHGAPDNISLKGYKLMESLMDDEAAARLADAYAPGEMSGNGTGTMKLKGTVGGTDRDSLDRDFGLATWTLIHLMESLAPGGEPGQDAAGQGLESLDLDKIYPLQPVIENLPESILAEARSEAGKMDDMLLTQTGIAFSRAFSEELGVDMDRIQSRYILKVGLFMLAIALVGGICVVVVSLLSSKIAAGTARNLRRDIFAKVISFSQAEFDRFSPASLITRATNDVLQIQTLLAMGIRMLCYAPIIAVGGIIMALGKSVSMGWIILLACIGVVGLIGIIMVVAVPKFKALQKLIDRINLITREGLSGLLVIRAFRNEEHEKIRFHGANRELAATYLFVNRAMSFMFPALMLIMNGISVLIIWVGAHQVADARMQVGDMMAFMQYAIMIIFSFVMISMMFVFIPRAAVAADRIAEVLETMPAVRDPEKPEHIPGEVKGQVEFRDVSFTYEEADEPAVCGISFVARPGQTTAFIGATGSGKSTLLNLIPRFYDATSGEILVDGVNVRNLPMKELRRHIGYVPQQSVLIGGTLSSNIRYGNPGLEEEEMNRVAEIAQALEFIAGDETGFEGEVSQGGNNLSGGQKQRVSIARALAVKPDIYLFDDSFSALDFKTDAMLRKALREYTIDATVLIVAQRVNTIMDADAIHVIKDGRIVGSGTHRELLASCPEYYDIASSQLSPEELGEKTGTDIGEGGIKRG